MSTEKLEKKKKNRFIRVMVVIVLLLAVIGTVSYFGAKRVFPLKHETVISQNAERFGVDKYLVMALIRTESNYRESVVSHANAIGLMQITDETGEFIARNLGYADYDISMLYNAEINIEFGTWYISWLIEKFDNNLDNALASYNAGFNKVNSWLSDEKYSSDGVTLTNIPYQETKNFVSRVNTYRSIYKVMY